MQPSSLLRSTLTVAAYLFLVGCGGGSSHPDSGTSSSEILSGTSHVVRVDLEGNRIVHFRYCQRKPAPDTNTCLVKLDPSGRRIWVLDTGKFQYSGTDFLLKKDVLQISADGSILFVDTALGVPMKVSPDGTLVWKADLSSAPGPGGQKVKFTVLDMLVEGDGTVVLSVSFKGPSAFGAEKESNHYGLVRYNSDGTLPSFVDLNVSDRPIPPLEEMLLLPDPDAPLIGLDETGHVFCAIPQSKIAIPAHTEGGITVPEVYEQHLVFRRVQPDGSSTSLDLGTYGSITIQSVSPVSVGGKVLIRYGASGDPDGWQHFAEITGDAYKVVVGDVQFSGDVEVVGYSQDGNSVLVNTCEQTKMGALGHCKALKRLSADLRTIEWEHETYEKFSAYPWDGGGSGFVLTPDGSHLVATGPQYKYWNLASDFTDIFTVVDALTGELIH